MSSELPTVLRGWQITQAKKKAAGNSRGPKSQSEIVLLFDPLRKTVQRKLDTICQNPPERVTRSVHTKPVRALDAFPDLRRGGRRRPHTIAGSASAIFRKEVIQPQVLLRLPCYDFTPIMSHTLGACLLAVSVTTSSTAHFRDVTGGVYKARERIHGVDLIRHY